MKVVAIVQARSGSTRLPNKVLKDIVGRPMIQLLLERLAKSEQLDEVILATGENQANDQLAELVDSLGIKVSRGSEQDVLDRYYQAAKSSAADVVVRITGDCPLVDPALVDQLIQGFHQRDVDYCSNTAPPTFPDGLDIEVFSFRILEQAALEAVDPFEREHVTPFMRRPDKSSYSVQLADRDWSSLRWTVDEPADLQVAVNVFEHFSPNIHFSWQEVLALHQQNPALFEANQKLLRNEGANMATGPKLWKRAKQVIPGGNMLLSKRAEMFLPDRWPAYYSRAKGCRVWDLDDNEYIDMTIMGVGTNTLGYGNEEVDAAVQEVVVKGNLSTLNCPEEVYLAEKMIEIHPWADMVRFARTGGEANAIAIRIARAVAGRDQVAICGYHGWHDWYLSANLAEDSNLDGHLLPGLDPAGVPKNLRGTVHPFNYNNFAELEALVAKHNIGVIKMEVVRNSEPKDGFLHKVRKLATDNNIVLVFDECTSGFRQSFGGLHKLYDVEPDIAVFGKTLGNGYAVTATIGRREIMEAAQSTFISSTFWTERIGSAAALKTLEVMERVRSWETITQTGLTIREGWQKLADKHQLEISHWGLPAITGFTFAGSSAQQYKTLITQEMLKRGYLAGNSVYSCTEHTPEIVEEFFANLAPVFALIAECENGRDIASLLEGPICHSGFQRLN